MVVSQVYTALSLAHGDVGLTPATLWSAWTWEPAIVVSIALSSALYGVGLLRLWRSAGVGSGVKVWQAASYYLAMAVLFVALISPLDALSDELLSAHMAQHMVLILVSAPLITFSALPVAFLWLLPHSMARRIGHRWRASRLIRPAWHALTQPLPAWFISTGVLWLWHFPLLYQAAVQNDIVHAIEHICFLMTSILFWQVLVGPLAARQTGYGVAVIYIFANGLQGAALGALMTFAGYPWYPVYNATAATWGTTALADQQFAGLIMWLPGGILFTVLAAVLFLAWLNALDHRHIASDRLPYAMQVPSAHVDPGEEVHQDA